MKPEHLMEIASTLFPNGTKVQAARKFAETINRKIPVEMQRSERTVEAYCQGQRKIPLEYAVTVMSFLQDAHPQLHAEMSEKEDGNSPISIEMRSVNLEDMLNRMERTVDKMQAASQSTGMLLAIRAMCEDCAGGPASEAENTCWWSNCPLRKYSDHTLAKNAQKL
jgi:hypothetical protein